MNDKLKKLVDDVKKGVIDLTQLDVTTVSGDITQVLDDKKRFDITKLRNEMNTPNGKIYVVAHTHIDLDKDVINFVKTDLTDSERNLFEAHQATIASSQQARLSLLKFLVEIVS